MIAITGAAGKIGSVVAPAFVAAGDFVRLLAVRPAPLLDTEAESAVVDIRDLDALVPATRGCAAIVHLAAITQEAPLPDLMEHNILATYNVLEAARQNSLRRVVLASTHHVMGFYRVGTAVRSSDSIAPDSLYAVSKVSGEALGSLYASKYGLEVAAIRIGSFVQAPVEPRHARTWLSPRDAAALFVAAATGSLPAPFTVLYGVSRNSLNCWPTDGWREIGYEPRDDAAEWELSGTDYRWHGGSYAGSE